MEGGDGKVFLVVFEIALVMLLLVCHHLNLMRLQWMVNAMFEVELVGNY